MYPTLQTDPAKAASIKNTVAELAAFGEQHRMELDTANRANKFLRELYRELGGRGYLGPSSQSSAAGWGGGVPEYVVISEEVGRHGLVSGQIAAQAIDADLVHRYMMGPHDGAWVSRFRFRKRLQPGHAHLRHVLNIHGSWGFSWHRRTRRVIGVGSFFLTRGCTSPRICGCSRSRSN